MNVLIDNQSNQILPRLHLQSINPYQLPPHSQNQEDARGKCIIEGVSFRRNRSVEKLKQLNKEVLHRTQLKEIKSQRHTRAQLLQKISKLHRNVSEIPAFYSQNRSTRGISERQRALSNELKLLLVPSDNESRTGLETKQQFLKSPRTLLISITSDGYENQNFQSNQNNNDIDQIFEKILQERGRQGSDQDFKFTFAKHQKNVEIFDPEPEIQQHSLQVNVHQLLLSEQNYYLREQLHLFVDNLEKYKHEASETKSKYRHIKKENTTLKRTIEELYILNDYLKQQILRKEEYYFEISSKTQEYLATISYLQLKKEQLANKFQSLQKEQDVLQSKIKVFQSNKDREIEAILEQKYREREQFLELLSDKDRQLQGLQELLNQMKEKFKSKNESPHKRITSSQNLQIENGEEGQEDTESTRTSFCLSLAEAQSLKTIIEQQEISHKLERNDYLQTNTQLKQQIKTLTRKIYELETQIKLSGVCQDKHEQQIIKQRQKILQ